MGGGSSKNKLDPAISDEIRAKFGLPLLGGAASASVGSTTPEMIQFNGMPSAQRGLLAQQLNEGFGGGVSGYRRDINNTQLNESVPYIRTPADVEGLLRLQAGKSTAAKKKKTTAKKTPQPAQAQIAARLPASWSSYERSRYGSGGNGGLYS